MNDKYLKIYRYPKGTVFTQTVVIDNFEPKLGDFEDIEEALASGIKGEDEFNQA